MNSLSDAVSSMRKDKVILSRFRAGLREDLRAELLVKGVTKLQKAYMLV